jgi:hypothetical protein
VRSENTKRTNRSKNSGSLNRHYPTVECRKLEAGLYRLQAYSSSLQTLPPSGVPYSTATARVSSIIDPTLAWLSLSMSCGDCLRRIQAMWYNLTPRHPWIYTLSIQIESGVYLALTGFLETSQRSCIDSVEEVIAYTSLAPLVVGGSTTGQKKRHEHLHFRVTDPCWFS